MLFKKEHINYLIKLGRYNSPSGALLLMWPCFWGTLAQFENQFIFAIGFFVLAGISDFLDGYLARKLSATSEFGMIADPIADKTLIIGTLISLSIVGEIDLWLAYMILGRDMIAVVGFILASILLSPYKVKTHFSGKAYTAFLLIFLGITILASAEIFSNQIFDILIISLLIFSIFLVY